MYIEDRLFSENSEEILYSVTLDEEEYYLFSEFQKEFGKIVGYHKVDPSVLKEALRILKNEPVKTVNLAETLGKRYAIFK